MQVTSTVYTYIYQEKIVLSLNRFSKEKNQVTYTCRSNIEIHHNISSLEHSFNRRTYILKSKIHCNKAMFHSKSPLVQSDINWLYRGDW